MSATTRPPTPPFGPDDAEAACGAVGDTVAQLFPPAPPPAAVDSALAVRLERALAGRRPSRPRRRLRLLPVFGAVALTGAAAAAALVWSLHPRALEYAVSGAPVAEGRVDTGAGRSAGILFSDGTSIALAERSVGRIKERTSAGATFALERGRASFAVVHRPGARWLVQAGPFEIAVTGTRFDVRWGDEPDARDASLQVTLHEGSVTVRGGQAGPGVHLKAGQRLLASPSRRLLTVGMADEIAPPRSVAPAPEALAAPAAKPEAAAEPAAPAPPPAPPARRQRHREAARAVAAAPAEDLLAPSPSAPEPSPALGAPNRELLMNAGGELCTSVVPQFVFEKWTEGFTVANSELLALRNRSLDHTHSWCGGGSLRLDADFNTKGQPNAFGGLPFQTGQVTVRLGQPIDLTDKLVVVHVYVDAPVRVQFGVQVFAINHGLGKWVAGGVDSNIAAGRWWTVRASFEEQAGLAKGTPSPLTRVDGLALQIYAIGQDRTWTGTVYIDDVGWR
jgi:hypothetical protein